MAFWVQPVVPVLPYLTFNIYIMYEICLLAYMTNIRFVIKYIYLQLNCLKKYISMIFNVYYILYVRHLYPTGYIRLIQKLLLLTQAPLYFNKLSNTVLSVDSNNCC